MSSNYVINLPLGTSGSSLDVTVPAGAVKTDYSLKLVGRGAPGYGLVFAENALKALTHHASVEGGRPGNPLIGQIWYNHSAKHLLHYVGPNVAGADANGWSVIPSATSTASNANTGPLAIANGGTGSTTANGAVLALGAVAKSGDALTGFLQVTVQAGIQASGASQSTAAELTSSFNEVTVSTANTQDGVRLPTFAPGRAVIVINASSSEIKVYPSSNCSIEGLAVNQSVPVGAGARLQFVAVSANKWYAMSAVYE
jgi:hypothetical protein